MSKILERLKNIERAGEKAVEKSYSKVGKIGSRKFVYKGGSSDRMTAKVKIPEYKRDYF